MTVRINQSWCPTCREWTVIDAGRPCAWCDTPLVRKRGGWKRPDQTGRITDLQARAVHAKYEQGVSARTLGRQLYQTLGYKTPQTCEAGIGKAFRRLGLPIRDRIEATVLASTSSGLSPRDDTLRRARRKAAGLTVHGKQRQPRCEGVRGYWPRKGERCARPAMFGSTFCVSHAPERQQEHQARLADARARIRHAQPKPRTGEAPPSKETGRSDSP